MNEPNDLQQATDIEQAKQRLQQAAETKENRKNPREGESTLITPRPKAGPGVEKEIHPVTGKPKKKKFGQKLKEAMFNDEIGKGSVSDYVFFKIIVPSFKRVVYEGLNTALCMALNMDPKTNRIIGGNSNVHTANASLYRDRNYNRSNYNGDSGYSSRRIAISEYEWDEETAKDIYNQIQDLIERYNECSLADAYSICGFGDKIRTTDRNWGWTSTRGMDVYPIDAMKERWVVDLPSARPLR